MAERKTIFQLKERIPIDDFNTLLQKMPEIYGDKDVFRYKEPDGNVTAMSAQTFLDMCTSFGAALMDIGLTQSKVAVVGETSPKWVATYFAQVAGGGVIVPIDKDLPDEEIARLLRESGAQAIVYAPSLEESVQAIRDDVPDVRFFIPMEGNGDGSWDALSAKGKPKAQEFLQRHADPDAMSTILYTAGTTGRSKGVMLTPRNIFHVAQGALQLLNFGPVCLSTLPIHHTYEFTHGITMHMMHGATICISESPRYFLQNVQLYKPDSILLVPMYIEMIYKRIRAAWKREGKEQELDALIQKSRKLMEQGIDKRKELFAPIHQMLGGRLEFLVSGGAPLSTFYIQAFEDFGIPLIQGYGITECSPVVSVNPNEPNRIGSVGPVLPCCGVRFANVDENGHGEIWVKGTSVMLGYYNDSEATQAVMQDGWFNTGDIGYMDEDDYLYITGRKKNLIVMANGKNVQPEEVESYFAAIPTISEIVVYAPADEIGNQRELHAQIYVDDLTRDGRTAEQLRAQLEQDIGEVNKKLPGYKQIADFILRDKPFDKTTKMSIQRFKMDTSL